MLLCGLWGPLPIHLNGLLFKLRLIWLSVRSFYLRYLVSAFAFSRVGASRCVDWVGAFHGGSLGGGSVAVGCLLAEIWRD